MNDPYRVADERLAGMINNPSPSNMGAFEVVGAFKELQAARVRIPKLEAALRSVMAKSDIYVDLADLI